MISAALVVSILSLRQGAEIEKAEESSIPIFHDDQHGTAVVTLAGLINALKVTGKQKESAKIVINGAGAAAIAITKLLHSDGFENIIHMTGRSCFEGHKENMNPIKDEISKVTNRVKQGTLSDALNDRMYLSAYRPQYGYNRDGSTMAKCYRDGTPTRSRKCWMKQRLEALLSLQQVTAIIKPD